MSSHCKYNMKITLAYNVFSMSQGAFHVNCTLEIHQKYADSYYNYNYIVIFVSPRQRSPVWSTWNAHWSMRRLAKILAGYCKILWGSCQNLTGYCQDFTGSCQNLIGYCKILWGSCQNLTGYCQDFTGSCQNLTGYWQILAKNYILPESYKIFPRSPTWGSSTSKPVACDQLCLVCEHKN